MGGEVRFLIALLLVSSAQASDWSTFEQPETVRNFNYDNGEYSIRTIHPGGSTTQEIYPAQREFEQSTPKNYIRNYREFERRRVWE